VAVSNILSREELHRNYAGEIRIEDFDTESPNKYRINRYACADKFNKMIKYRKWYRFRDTIM